MYKNHSYIWVISEHRRHERKRLRTSYSTQAPKARDLFSREIIRVIIWVLYSENLGIIILLQKNTRLDPFTTNVRSVKSSGNLRKYRIVSIFLIISLANL